MTESEREILRKISDKCEEQHPYEVLLSLLSKGLIDGIPLDQGMVADISITEKGMEALENSVTQEELNNLTKENLRLQNKDIKCRWWTEPINIISAVLSTVVAGITIYLFILDK
jgi:hypothetical protein